MRLGIILKTYGQGVWRWPTRRALSQKTASESMNPNTCHRKSCLAGRTAWRMIDTIPRLAHRHERQGGALAVAATLKNQMSINSFGPARSGRQLLPSLQVEQKLHELSSSRKFLKKEAKRATLLSTSAAPIVSRIECIDSDGTPTSTVRSPVFAAMIGPIVVPQGQSFFTMNS
mmetsp:Transcript_27447/g.57881  ORF Transcript_27447/g.57881 Transcript_27447/m.57881 type:complete len:173 (-) Transcript_27447:1204-1722(-)